MSNNNSYKANFFKKINFDEKTRVMRDNGAGETLEGILAENFTREELDKASAVGKLFQQAAAGLFCEATQNMKSAMDENEELGSLTLEVSTEFGDLEVAMNRPEGGFTRENIANATGIGIKQKLDSDSFQEIYDDLDKVFED